MSRMDLFFERLGFTNENYLKGLGIRRLIDHASVLNAAKRIWRISTV